jgi:transcription-repair coupling factor (superfamily II helicase)
LYCFSERPVFETFKVYTHKQVSLQEVGAALIRLGYQRVQESCQEGDFSIYGDTLEVFPVNFRSPVRLEWDYEAVSRIYSFDKVLKRKIENYDLLIVIPRLAKTRRYTYEDVPLEAFLQVKKGDYVVHTRYGIGRFLGTRKMKVKGLEGYYYEIEYDRKDKLYVSKEDAHLIQKYSSFSSKQPKLTRLGSRQWLKVKERVEQAVKVFALGILKRQAQRKIIGGFVYPRDDNWQRDFEKSFPYKETPDQLRATIEVKEDMCSPECMDRIICGDVGYGKTEVAMRAAFKAVNAGKQVAFLVPTTILAYQHYTNLCRRLSDFPFYVEMLSRFRTPSQQMSIIKKIKEGKIDIIVATHRLLSNDVAFKDIGLLIIDEEHRFGVAHKEKMKKIKVGVDILTLSATPIPRTLYMSFVGLKNISIIRTAPQDRLSVKTKVVPFNRDILAEAIVKEKKRNGQVFFIHNRVHSIKKIENSLRKSLPEGISLAVVHGQMPVADMEKIMLDFIDGKIDCLLSTAIVESGIDIPTANTIIIDDAHRFGLADLHQLRGRVGRLNIQAYAYLIVPPESLLPEEARQRLRHICEFSHLGAGFEIAMSDLELRGAGNILGKEQHGFIWMIGFDLYCRLLKKEIEYLKKSFKLN